MSHFVSVLYDFDGSQVENGLTCSIGDILEVVDDCSDWLWVSFNGKEGFVPSTFVEIVKNQINVPKEVTKVNKSIDYVNATSSFTVRRDRELDNMLKRKQKVADIKVDSNIDENTLRKGDMGTIKSQRSMDDIEKEIKESRSNYHYDSAHEEEKKKYDFKRDPQLDTLLKRKQRMMEQSKEPQPQEERERKFEFKRDPELDAVLKRKQRVATRVVDEGDADKIRNVQTATVIIPQKRTKEDIMKELEEWKNDNYREPKAIPKIPSSKPIRPSLANELDSDPQTTVFNDKEFESPQDITQSSIIDQVNDEINNDDVLAEKVVESTAETPSQSIPMSSEQQGNNLDSKTDGDHLDLEMDALLDDVDINDILADIDMIPEDSNLDKQSITQDSNKQSIIRDSNKQSLSIISTKQLSISTVQTNTSLQEPIPCMVIEDFYSRNDQEITVYAGELVNVLGIYGEYCLIQTTVGEEGYIPTHLLHEISNEYRQARILYNFEGNGENQLTVRENEIVIVLSEEGEWMEGQNQEGIIGWFPVSFAEYI